MTYERLDSPTGRDGLGRRLAGARSYYDLYGRLLLEVRGEGGRAVEQFRSMYRRFEVPAPARRPDVVVERTTDDRVAERAFGGPNDHYGWTGESFVVRRGSEYMAVRPGWDHIAVTPNFEPFDATYPVEFRLRQRLVEEGRALVHASGVERDGVATVFPAWRSAGKTNTLLSLLGDGCGFLADDRLWLGADGTAWGYPLAVNVHPRNVQSFPGVEVEHEDVESRVREWADQHIQDRFGSGESVAEKALSFLSERFVASSGRNFLDIETAFPEVEYVEEAPVANVVLLCASPTAERVTVEPVPAREVAAAITAIDHYEWNQRLAEYFRAYDALVGDAAVEELAHVVEREEQIVGDVLQHVDTYRAAIPQHLDWAASGLDRAVADAVRTIQDRQRTAL
ncbi:hypothetical protein [Halomarina rubra]|uniref:Uncharacterized protein n=1 Tax=Halomarina rubra TaxID=2071873 RepID=A0ABD6B1P8_9EURY|nr:hypothetical protein [Halomarina rubra]